MPIMGWYAPIVARGGSPVIGPGRRARRRAVRRRASALREQDPLPSAQPLFHVGDDGLQVPGVLHEIQPVGGHHENGGERETPDPFLVQRVQAGQVLVGDARLEVPPPEKNAPAERRPKRR